MCNIINIKVGDRNVRVADIKQKYIYNIADAAKKCRYIDRIVLFGSSTMERCKESSDIDIAVFGSAPKGRALTSKSFIDFAGQLYAFDDYSQAYDILYFKTGTHNNASIMNDIENGEVIYVRQE
ncbi:MAG: nucleotidyltransferase domain-containing protein [Lachnospiraceae bacterium]|nr:nucleotidyltransferase domain-containing protein [Lachnospiraceae bacterium]